MAPFDPFAFMKVVDTTYGLMNTYKKTPNYAERLNFNLAMFPQLNALNTLNEAALATPTLIMSPVMTYDSYTLKAGGGGAGVAGGGVREGSDLGSGFGILAASGVAVDASNGSLSIPKPSVTSKAGASLDIFNRIKELNVDRFGSLKWLADNMTDISEGALWVQSNKGNFGSIFDFYSQYGASIIAVLNAKPLFADWEKTDLLNLTKGILPKSMTDFLDNRFYLDNLKAIAAGDLRSIGLTNLQTSINNMIADGINGANIQIDTSGFQKLLTDTFDIKLPQGTSQDSFYDFLGKWFSGLPSTDTILSTMTKKLGVSMPTLFTGDKGVVPWFKSMAGDLDATDPLGFAGITKKFAALRVQLEKRVKNISTYATAMTKVPTNLEFSAKVTVTVKRGWPNEYTHTTTKTVEGDNFTTIMSQAADIIGEARDKESDELAKMAASSAAVPILIKLVGAILEKGFGDVAFYGGKIGDELKGIGDDLVSFIGQDIGQGVLKDFGGLNLSSLGLGNKFTDIGKGFGDLNLDWKFPTLGA